MDRDVVVQYIQHEKIAKDFANYLSCINIKMDYQLDAVLQGKDVDPLLLKKQEMRRLMSG